MTKTDVKQAIENVLSITEPTTKKESFLLLASFTLLNAAVKHVQFRKIVSYGFIKPRVTRLFEYYITTNNKKLIDAIYFNPEEKCFYFRIYGIQISFHDIIGNHSELQQFVNSPRNVKMEWTGIRLQPVAEKLYNLAVRNLQEEIDVSGDIVKIINDARQLNKKKKQKNKKVITMANIAFTTYIVESDKTTLEALEAKLNDMPYSPEFNIQEISYLDSGEMCIIVESPWKENKDMRHQLEQEFPGTKFWYNVELEDQDLWATNDKEGRFFPHRFLIEDKDGNEEVCRTKEEAETKGIIVLECMVVED